MIAMDTYTPFYVFSVQRVELSADENRRRVEFVAAYLKRAKVPFLHVQGRYKGEDESAFLVLDYPAEQWRTYVLNLARLYEQESVLYVDANRLASLYSSEGGRIGELGRWLEVSADQAAKLDAVTQTSDGRFWSAQA